jgi:hypothetical protein
MSLTLPHRKFPRSVLWRVTPAGVALEGSDRVFRTRGQPRTAQRIWAEYQGELRTAWQTYSVPIPILIAIAATESRGDRSAARHEPGYAAHLVDGIPSGAGIGWLNSHHRELPVENFVEADEATPGRVSLGVMQVLISTARDVLGDGSIGRAELLQPGVSFAAGAAYVRQQADLDPESSTFLDPVLVAAAYNAGGLYQETATANPWRLRCYPLGTGGHISRFVKWYGDACAVGG